MAHGHDFRSEVIKAGHDETTAETAMQAVMGDWRTADLPAADRALCAFAEKATLHPQQCGEDDVNTLRKAGLDDVAIHDATQVIAYFNYINRIADCLGVDLEPEMLQSK